MANKTIPTKKSVQKFIDTVTDPKQQDDARTLLKLFTAATGERPVMWGNSIIGFGSYDYTYASGRTGTWLRVGFSPRKGNLSLYLSCDASDFDDKLKQLGPHTRGKGCVYIKSLDNIDNKVLSDTVKSAYTTTKQHEN